MIEHAPSDQAEDDYPIQPPEDAADSIEEFFYGWEDPQPEAPIPQLRRSSRIPKPTERYRCLIGTPSHLPTSTTNAEEASSPSTKIFGKQNLTVKQALSSKDQDLWRSAMDDEYASLMKNNTWEIVQLPDGRAVIKCRWVFDIKPGYEGVPERYKARLVALGCSQQPGIDFNQTFAPVVKMSTLRLILALVAAHNLEVPQLDVKTAFLHGRLDEEMYICQPEGYVVQGREKDVCKLMKSLYGLKQAPRA
jgi:hypothetical protein